MWFWVKVDSISISKSIVTDDIAPAGGMENMSQSPMLSRQVASVLKWDINQWLIAWYMMV